MMVASLVFAALAVVAPANEYFPLHEGDEYQYEEVIGKRKYALVKKIGAPAESDPNLVPMVTDNGSGEPESTFYRATESAVNLYMLVSRQKKMKGQLQVDDLGNPVMEKKEITYPVFKVTGREVEWAYSGQTALLSDFASLEMTGKAKFLGKKPVLGSPRDVIQVTMEMTVGAADGPAIRETNVSYYAKGVGLYQMDSTQIFGKRKQERHTRLLAYIPKVGTANQ
jgi:hypothetical protein